MYRKTFTPKNEFTPNNCNKTNHRHNQLCDIKRTAHYNTGCKTKGPASMLPNSSVCHEDIPCTAWGSHSSDYQEHSFSQNMVASVHFETSIDFYHITQCYVPDRHNLQPCNNLEGHCSLHFNKTQFENTILCYTACVCLYLTTAKGTSRYNAECSVQSLHQHSKRHHHSRHTCFK